MTEEELAALIDQAVADAVAATEQTTAAVTSTTSDTSVTSDEVAYVYDYYYNADYYVEYAEDLLNEYYNLYSDLAYEMIAELNAIENELNQLNSTLSSIDSSLQQINSTLQQGLEVAQDTIDQLNNAAQQTQSHAAELKSQAQDMAAVLQADQQNRLDQMAQIQPNNIPTDKLAALQTGFQFIDEAKLAMGDNKLSRDELMNLAQLGANAQAGFQKFGGAAGGQIPGLANGGPDLTQFSAKFSELTTQFARGQMPQARAGLDGFERSLGQRPSGGPSRPGGGPGLPGRP
jgi:DNA repair exonuclease SbcCD ATPase subunit